MPSEPSRREVNADDRLDLLQAMRALSDDERLVLALRYFIDLPSDEGAQVLHTSPAATKRLILRPLQALRPVLHRESRTTQIRATLHEGSQRAFTRNIY